MHFGTIVHIEWTNQFASSNGSTLCLSYAPFSTSYTDTIFIPNESFVNNKNLCQDLFTLFRCCRLPIRTLRVQLHAVYSNVYAFLAFLFCFVLFLLFFSVADAIIHTSRMVRPVLRLRCISQFYITRSYINAPCTYTQRAGYYTVCFNWKLPKMHCLWSGWFWNCQFWWKLLDH